MTNTLIHGIIDALSGSVSKEVIVFLISMIPILELRGALLVAGPILGVKVSTAPTMRIRVMRDWQQAHRERTMGQSGSRSENSERSVGVNNQKRGVPFLHTFFLYLIQG